jgi:CIC family chloride channel protein
VTVFLWSGRLGVFSLGYDDLSDALNHRLAWQVAGVLLVAKLLATVACYGFGSAGGIFSPTLFFGGMGGVFVGGVAALALGLNRPDQMTLAVVGMSACLGAVVRAPVTGILIVFEMTHEFSLVPALMLGALISQTLARRLTHENFYDAILTQDGHVLQHVIPPRDLQTWQQLPVSAVANFHPVVLTGTDDASVSHALTQYAFQRFPVVQSGAVAGILTRKEAQAALQEHRPPRLDPAITCPPGQNIRQLQMLLVESTTLLVVIVSSQDRRVLGLVTLHDLLRAELNLGNGLG